jgi:hypothetical protein
VGRPADRGRRAARARRPGPDRDLRHLERPRRLGGRGAAPRATARVDRAHPALARVPDPDGDRPDVELARYATAEAEVTHWPTPAALLGLLVAYALLLTALGYALATTAFVWLTAWLPGSDKPVRDAVVGLGLGVVAGYAFSHWLNVQLPSGPWGV